MKEIRFFAMMRSGHHAIINWLLAQLSQSYTFVNDPLHPSSCLQKKLSKPEDLYLLYNIEDRFIKEGIKETEEKLYNHSEVRKGDILNVLILRDPFNLFASRYARETKRKNLVTGEKQSQEIRQCNWSPLKGWTSNLAIECWKSHAKEINYPTCINLIINYNQWFKDQEYRKKISEYFEVKFNDEYYNQMALVQGEGSSFDGNEIGNVLERYKNYMYDKYYLSLFDKEILNLAEQIFGWKIKCS